MALATAVLGVAMCAAVSDGGCAALVAAFGSVIAATAGEIVAVAGVAAAYGYSAEINVSLTDIVFGMPGSVTLLKPCSNS